MEQNHLALCSGAYCVLGLLLISTFSSSWLTEFTRYYFSWQYLFVSFCLEVKYLLYSIDNVTALLKGSSKWAYFLKIRALIWWIYIPNISLDLFCPWCQWDSLKNIYIYLFVTGREREFPSTCKLFKHFQQDWTCLNGALELSHSCLHEYQGNKHLTHYLLPSGIHIIRNKKLRVELGFEPVTSNVALTCFK